MNHVKLVAGLTALIAAVPAWADWQYPFLAPNHCRNSVVNRPENSSVFYRSEDCNTIFVLPPAAGTVDYKVSISTLMDLDCDQYSESMQDLAALRKQKRKLEEDAQKPGLSERDYEFLRRRIKDKQDSLDLVSGSLNTMAATEGASMRIRLSLGLPEEVNRFQFLNQLLFAQGTRFESAPIADSFVSFLSVNESATERRPAVIASNIPGIEVRGVKSAPGSDSRIMNGSVSGRVVLGLNAVCSMRDRQNVSVHKIAFSPDEMESHVAANLTYAVPVQTAFRYHATLDSEMVVRDWIKRWENRPDQFTLSSLALDLTDGEVAKHVRWEFIALDGIGGTTDNQTLSEFEEQLRAEVMGRMAKELADLLAATGVLEKQDPVVLAPPQPGTQAETHYQRVCRSTSALGIKLGQKCWDQPYTVVRVRGSTSDQVIESVRKAKLNSSETVQFKQVIYRTHTSTFKYQN